MSRSKAAQLASLLLVVAASAASANPSIPGMRDGAPYVAGTVAALVVEALFVAWLLGRHGFYPLRTLVVLGPLNLITWMGLARPAAYGSDWRFGLTEAAIIALEGGAIALLARHPRLRPQVGRRFTLLTALAASLAANSLSMLLGENMLQAGYFSLGPSVLLSIALGVTFLCLVIAAEVRMAGAAAAEQRVKAEPRPEALTDPNEIVPVDHLVGRLEAQNPLDLAALPAGDAADVGRPVGREPASQD